MSEILTYDSQADTWRVSFAAERSKIELVPYEYAPRFTSADPDPESTATLHARGEVVDTDGREGIVSGALVEFTIALDTPLQVHRATVTSMLRFCSELSGIESTSSALTIDGVSIGDFEPTFVEPKGDAQERAALAIEAANAGVEHGPGEYPSVRNALYHYARLANWGTPTTSDPAPLRVLVASLRDDSLAGGEYADASFDGTFASFVPEWDMRLANESEPNATARRKAGIPEWAGVDWDAMDEIVLDGDELSQIT